MGVDLVLQTNSPAFALPTGLEPVTVRLGEHALRELLESHRPVFSGGSAFTSDYQVGYLLGVSWEFAGLPRELSDGRRRPDLMQDFTDADLIRFTTRFYRQAGAKDRAIRETFGLTNTKFWQATLQLIQDPARVDLLPADLQAQVSRLIRRFTA